MGPSGDGEVALGGMEQREGGQLPSTQGIKRVGKFGDGKRWGWEELGAGSAKVTLPPVWDCAPHVWLPRGKQSGRG